jgi:hypothetical protein
VVYLGILLLKVAAVFRRRVKRGARGVSIVASVLVALKTETDCCGKFRRLSHHQLKKSVPTLDAPPEYHRLPLSRRPVTRSLMVPVERIELPTFGLQNRCSTAELNRRSQEVRVRSIPELRCC